MYQTMQPDIFEYINFRKYLTDLFDSLKRHSPRFSYRSFARMAGSSSPNFLQLIQAHKLSLSKTQTASLAESLNMDPQEKEFLGDLVAFDRAKRHEEKDRLFRKIMRAGRESDRKLLDTNQYEYFAKWYYSAIRAVLGYHRFNRQTGNYGALGRMLNPPISENQARRSVKLLEKLGLVTVDSENNYVPANTIVSTGEEIQSFQVAAFQAETLNLAQKSLEKCPQDQREISTLTLNISEQGFHRIKERIRNLRSEIIGIAEADVNDDRVYQCNFQLFPLTKIKRAGRTAKGRQP